MTEEVQDAGLSQLKACRSLPLQAMRHILKLPTWPESLAAGPWREKAETLLDDAGQRFSPSMRQRMDLEELYARALFRARNVADNAGQPRPLPDACPFTLDDLLKGDLTRLIAVSSQSISP